MNLPVRNSTDFLVVCLTLISFPVLPEIKKLIMKKISLKTFFTNLLNQKIKLISFISLILLFILSAIYLVIFIINHISG